MLHVVKFALNRKSYGLKFAPNLDKNVMWDLAYYSNSDYAGNLDSHQSVSSYILYMQNVPIS